jgi:LAO/AO transport system kinase
MSVAKKKKANIEKPMALVEGVRQGEVRSIARMISFAEANKKESFDALTEIYRSTGRAHIIGVTGVPGSGKSSLVGALAKAIRNTGKTVGIVAIDPSSPFSGGAILGDRIRMTDLTGDDGVFIRSMATRGAMGGLARASLDTVDILDAAGFDIIIIETVGVGQDEVDIVRAAHTVTVVSAPGLGDEIQAIKAGILEIADIHVVSKCDRPDAYITISDINNMLALGSREPRRLSLFHTNNEQKENVDLSIANWQVSVIATSAETGEGIDELLSIINDHIQYLNETGEIQDRRRDIIEMRVIKLTEDLIRKKFRGNHDKISSVIDSIMHRVITPRQAAEELLKNFKYKE